MRRIILSFLIFLLILALFGNFITNDRPIYILYDSQIFTPIFNNKPYLENEFGINSNLIVEFTNPHFISYIESKGGKIVFTLFRSGISSLDHGYQNIAFLPPSLSHILGTNSQGIDVFAIICYSLKSLLLGSVLISFFNIVIGLFFGMIQPIMGGKWDFLGQRFYEILVAIPIIYVVLLLSSILSTGIAVFVMMMVLANSLFIVPYARGVTLKIMNEPYVEYLRVSGVSQYRIVMYHMLPNVWSHVGNLAFFVLVSNMMFIIGFNIFGIQIYEDIPVFLGDLLLEGIRFLHAPWILGSVCGVIIIICSYMIMILNYRSYKLYSTL